MTDKYFELKIGKRSTTFSIPEEQLLCELAGKNLTPPDNLKSAYRYALEHPIDSPPLSEIVKPGETVAL